ncbi:MAG: helix-turn-helix transcriptional regulator [Flavobacteriales bacterium]|nr:helix-turn-helix transcriptional regulator [Flavobacteriales bacterium]
MEVISLELYGQPFAESFTFSNDFRIPQEMHNDACLAYVVEGAHQLISSTKTLTLNTRDSVLMKCGNYLAFSNGVSAISPMKGVAFHFNPETIKKAFGSRDLNFLKVEVNKEPVDPAVALGQNELIDGFVESLTPYFNNKNLVNDDLLSVKLVELVTILVNSRNNPLVAYIMGTINSPEHLEFDKVIEANLYNNLSIPELAHLTYRSESKFKRDFNAYYSESPAKYLKSKKLEKAAKLLNGSSMQVGEIAWDCGFENAAHFSTSFTKIYGVSPREFKGLN